VAQKQTTQIHVMLYFVMEDAVHVKLDYER